MSNRINRLVICPTLGALGCTVGCALIGAFVGWVAGDDWVSSGLWGAGVGAALMLFAAGAALFGKLFSGE